MALKYVDDWSFWTTMPGTLLSAGGTCSISGGRFICPFNGNSYLLSNGLTAERTYIVNQRLNFEGPPTMINALQPSGDAGQNYLSMHSSGKFQYVRGYFGGILIGSISPLAVQFDTNTTFYDVESKVYIDSSNGTAELRINGGVQINETGLNTQARAANTADIVWLVGNTTGGGAKTYSEHAIVMDDTGTAMNDFIGPVNVEFLPPTGDGFYQDWGFTGAASAWQAVQDDDGDTSYISDNVVSDTSTFTHGTISSGNTVVKGAAMWTRAKRDDSTTRAFKNFLRLSGSDDVGPVEHFPGNAYIYYFTPYELSPFSGVAWTISDINNVEYGVQLTT